MWSGESLVGLVYAISFTSLLNISIDYTIPLGL